MCAIEGKIACLPTCKYTYNMNISLQEHPVTLEINGNHYCIDAELRLSDVERLNSAKSQDSNSMIADIIASRINKEYGTSFTKEQILTEDDSILPVFLNKIPHLQDSSAEGFQTAEELVTQVKEHYTKLLSMIKDKFPKMPDYTSILMPSQESIKGIGDFVKFEQERRLDEYTARESTRETASNTAELLTALSQMKSEDTESNIKQHRVNVIILLGNNLVSS